MFRRWYNNAFSLVKRKDSRSLQILLDCSLWISRIYILLAIVPVIVWSFWDSLDNPDDIKWLLGSTGVQIAALLYFVTVQSILPSRAIRHKINLGGSSSNPSRPSVVLPIVDAAFLVLLTMVNLVPIIEQNRTWDFGSKHWVFTLALTFAIVQIFLSICLLILRVVIIRDSNRKCLYAPFYDDSDIDGPRARAQSLTIMPGKSSRFIGEHPFLIFLRMLVLVILVYGLVAFAMYVIIIEPGGLGWDNPKRGIQISQQSNYDLPDRLVVKVALSSTQESTDDVNNAVSVSLAPSTSSNACTNGSPTKYNIVVTCDGYSEGTDAIITIDFSQLSSSSGNLRAYVYVGGYHSEQDDSGQSDTDPTNELQSNTLPFPLAAGEYYAAYATLESRQIVTTRADWLLGMFSTTNTYSIANIFRSSPAEAGDSNKASLRLTWLGRYAIPNVKVVSDNNDKTAIKGLSSVGGLFSSLNGIFGLLFGGSLMYHLLGSKPLGIFGLLHKVQKRELVKLNDIPYPSTPLEKFLGHFFVDFAEDAHDEEAGLKVSDDTNLSDTSDEKPRGGYDTPGVLRDKESLRYRGPYEKEANEGGRNQGHGIDEYNRVDVKDGIATLRSSEEARSD